MQAEELIDKYFEGSLNETDLIEFNERLLRDVNFAQEVEFRKKIQAAIHLNERAALKTKLQKFEHQETKVAVMPKRSAWFVAAAFALIIAGTIWILFPKPDAQELYRVYYEPYPNIVAPVTRSTTVKDSITQYAFILYDAGNYSDAALIFQKIYANSKAPFALMYLGICNLQTEKTTAAITILKTAASEKNEYAFIAKWYLAMAYLKNDEPLLALPLVQVVANNNNEPLQPVAEKLYEKLKAYE